MKRTIGEKKTKFENKSQQPSVAASTGKEVVINVKVYAEGKKKTNEPKKNDDPVTRLVRMAVLYTTSSLLFKLPNVLISVSDLVVIVSSGNNMEEIAQFMRPFNFENFLTKYICTATKICQVSRKYVNFLKSSYKLFKQ